jgi:hypothetical protein
MLELVVPVISITSPLVCVDRFGPGTRFCNDLVDFEVIPGGVRDDRRRLRMGGRAEGRVARVVGTQEGSVEHGMAMVEVRRQLQLSSVAVGMKSLDAEGSQEGRFELCRIGKVQIVRGEPHKLTGSEGMRRTMLVQGCSLIQLGLDQVVPGRSYPRTHEV